MEENPASRTVKGLSIAIIVLSILGILSSFSVLSVGNTVCDAIINGSTSGVTTENDNQSTEYDETTRIARCLMDNLSEDQAEVLGQVMVYADQSSAKKLGKAIVSQDSGKIDKALVYMCNSSTEASIADEDISEVAEALANVSKSDAKTIGSGLYSMEETGCVLVSDKLINSSDPLNDFDVSGVSQYGLTVENLAALISGLIGVIFAVSLARSIITLVSGILALRNREKPSALKGAFVLTVIGAVVSGLTLSIIMLILEIINAVYINKVRKAPSQPIYV